MPRFYCMSSGWGNRDHKIPPSILSKFRDEVGGHATSNSWQSPSGAPDPNPSIHPHSLLHNSLIAISMSISKWVNMGWSLKIYLRSEVDYGLGSFKFMANYICTLCKSGGGPIQNVENLAKAELFDHTNPEPIMTWIKVTKKFPCLQNSYLELVKD